MSANILILGGGFGGLYTALRLDQLPWEQTPKPRITLVDQHDRFVFLPLLYELITRELATWEIAPPYAELLANTSIHFQQAKVERIDLATQAVDLSTGERLPYDQLVLALGGETPMNLAPGVAEQAIPFRSLADAYRLEEQLRSLEESSPERIRVAIAGAGYSGIELACKIAERLGARGRVRIIELGEQILRNSPEFNREAARKALDAQGVWIDLETKITALRPGEMDLQYKDQTDTLPVDLVLWTVGNQVSPAIATLSLPKTPRGQLRIGPTLQVEDHPHLFALGDLAQGTDAEGQTIPSTAQAAFQQADYTAWNIWASLTGRPLLPFRYQNLGEMMTLGSSTATLSGMGLTLEGPLAHIARRLIYLYRMPTVEHQVRVGFNWITKPLQDLLSP